jgi:hypothetical protein
LHDQQVCCVPDCQSVDQRPAGLLGLVTVDRFESDDVHSLPCHENVLGRDDEPDSGLSPVADAPMNAYRVRSHLRRLAGSASLAEANDERGGHA